MELFYNNGNDHLSGMEKGEAILEWDEEWRGREQMPTTCEDGCVVVV